MNIIKGIKVIAFVTVFMLIVNVANAQEITDTTKTINDNSSGMNKQVDVVKRYVPSIGSAVRMDVEPAEIKKIQIKVPKLSYTVAYKPQPYVSVIKTLAGGKLSTTEYEKSKNGYLDLGYGYPTHSKASFYYNSKPMDNVFIGGGITHNGFWGKLKNDMFKLVDATDTQNDAFIFVDYKKNRLSMSGSAKYTYDEYTKYGVYLPVIPENYKFNTGKNIFNTIDIGYKIGTPHSASNEWNGEGYINGNYMFDNSKYSELFANVGGEFYKSFKAGRFKLGLGLDYNIINPSVAEKLQSEIILIDKKDHEIYSRYSSSFSTIKLTPTYLRVGKNTLLNINLGLIWEFNKNKTKFKFLPNISFQLNSNRFSAKVALRSDVKYNSYANLSKANPYLLSGVKADNTYSYDLYLGLNGTIFTWLSWGIEIGGRADIDLPYFYNVFDQNQFTVTNSYGPQTYFYADGYLSAQVTNKLVASVRYMYQGLDLYTYAQHNVKFNLMYKFAPRWKFVISGEVISSREFVEVYPVPEFGNDNAVIETTRDSKVTIPTKVDLSASIEFDVLEWLSIRIDGNNLLNTKMYKYNHYAGDGINGMLSLNLKF